MNKLITKENLNIETLIYETREKQVMLASDVARLYNVETKRVNETIKRNINRFPESFCFQLTGEEVKQLSLRSQTATLNTKGNMRGQHYKFLPYVLSEQGIMMLSGLLKSDKAVRMNILIINAFVAMKKYISYNLLEQKYINDILIKHESDIKSLQTAFNKFKNEETNNHIFFEGQIYDAYSKITDILKKSKKKLIIIDSYADKTTLDIISEIKVEVILITGDCSKLKKIDIEKYNEQYKNLKIIYNNTFHDRYYIIDNKKIYHSGTSINNAGNKTFSINLLTDKIVISKIIEKAKNIIVQIKLQEVLLN